MGLVIHVEKQEEKPSHCVYAFGPPNTPVGRAALDKETGDIELLDLSSTTDGPSEQLYLSHVVPRLQSYHDQQTYPASDTLEV